jgi:murein DD-endopeptidase MepM/ murein hydrolase activator NlpD
VLVGGSDRLPNRLLLTAAALLAVSPAGASAQAAAPDVSWAPERPAEGELFVVRVTPEVDDPVVLIAGQAGPEALHFQEDSDGSFASLAAVPLGEQAELWLSLTLVYPDGRERQINASVPVTPGTYNHRQLRVAPELGSPPSPEQRARRARESAMAAEVSAGAHRTSRLWTPELVMPRDAPVTSSFGDGRVFNGQVSSRHTGLDLRGAPGDTVVAPTRGVVALVEQFELAGNNVYINHGAGLVTAYFHLSEQLVSEGDTVAAGMPIGRVGSTGRVTGPHLHWVVRYGNTSVDPRSLLAASEELPAPE